MRNQTFYVPKKAIRDFSQLLDDFKLDNTIQGVDDEGDIIVQVFYEKDEEEGIEKLHELVDPFHEEEGEKEDNE